MKLLIFTHQEYMEKNLIDKYYPIVDSIIYPIDRSMKVVAMRKQLDKYCKSICSLEITHILVLSSHVFKILTKEKKVGHAYGKLFPCIHPGYEGIQVAVAPGYQSLFRNPGNINLIQMTLDTLFYGEKQYTQVKGTVLRTAREAIEAIHSLKAYDALAVDIEGFSLHYTKAKIATIAFAWSSTEGIVFESILQGIDLGYHLAEFFMKYPGQLIFHNSSYDVSVLIFELFMQHKLDYKNMLDALDIFYRNCEDTKLMVYLVNNSTADISLALKDNILEEYGDYGLDVTDITVLPLNDLLDYNLKDACGTYWLYTQYKPKLVAAQQYDLYYQKFMPAQKVLTYMQMVGMPMHRKKIQEAKQELQKVVQKQLDIIQKSPYIQEVELLLKKEKVKEDNLTLKKLVRTLDNVTPIPFNPGSGKHLGKLFHKILGLPILATTPTGMPSTDEDTIKKLLKHIQEI